MRTIRAEGVAAVVAVLRDLADQIEADAPTIHAVVFLPEDDATAEETLEIRIRPPATHKWNPVQLIAALSHPGD